MNLRNSSFNSILLAASLTLCVVDGQAQFLFNSISGQSGSVIGTNLTAGATFTVGNQPILVTALGVYDDQLDGLNQSYDVGIWNSSGLLTSTTVPTGSGATLLGNFRYASITPLVLAANSTYRVGANVGFNNAFPFDLTGQGGTAAVDPAFSFANPQMFSGFDTGFADPALVHPFSQNLWAANLQFTAVPEPTVLVFLGSAIAVMSMNRRRC